MFISMHSKIEPLKTKNISASEFQGFKFCKRKGHLMLKLLEFPGKLLTDFKK